jgi:hypothetical protein
LRNFRNFRLWKFWLFILISYWTPCSVWLHR